MFSLICTGRNSWANNRHTGDLRCHCAHYDVTVMGPCFNIKNISPGIGIPIIKMRRSADHLIFVIGIPVLVRHHLYIEIVYLMLGMYVFFVCVCMSVCIYFMFVCMYICAYIMLKTLFALSTKLTYKTVLWNVHFINKWLYSYLQGCQPVMCPYLVINWVWEERWFGMIWQEYRNSNRFFSNKQIFLQQIMFE